MNLRLLFLLCSLPLFYAVDFAQSLSTSLPARFERVERVEQVECGGYYMIGCNIEGRYFFLSNTYHSAKKGLRGFAYGERPFDGVVRNDYSLVWFLRPQTDGTLLIARPDSAEALSRNGDNGLKVSLTDTIHYHLFPGENPGTFSFKNGNRFLSAVLNVPIVYFVQLGVNRPHSFELFRANVDPVWWEDSYVPERDCRAAFAIDGSVLSGRQNLIPVSDYLLCDGTLAYDDAFALCDLRWRGKQTFTLTDASGNTVAGVPLFEFTDGCIRAEGKSDSRLVFDQEQGQLLLWTAETDIPVSRLSAVSLSEVGGQPSTEISDGVRILRGSWSASALAAIDWADFYNLDLTQIVLPQQVEAFTSRPLASNAIIYVPELYKEKVPVSWPFVVLTGENGNRLYRTTELSDGGPLLIDRSFSVQGDQISYQRVDRFGDGGWETLFLPFEVNVTNALTCEIVESFDPAENSLTFTRRECLPAHTPALIRFDNAQAVCFKSAAPQTIVPYECPTSDGIAGTYMSLVISRSDNVYLLNSLGTAFRQADTGSRLAPFRAYLSGSKDCKVRHRILSE